MSDGAHEEQKREQIKELGSVDLEGNKSRHRIKLLTVIGEIEGHEAVSGNAKSTKYEHMLPLLAEVEDRYTSLKKALAPLVADFDYIVIDCPPSLGLLSLNALTASDTLVVPLQCEYYALEGLSQLLSTVRTVKQYYNEHLELEGVVYTMYDSRLRLTQQVVDEVNKYFPNKAFHTMIPRSVKLAEAPSFGMPVIYYEKYSKPSFAYKKFADEFLKKQKKW